MNFGPIILILKLLCPSFSLGDDFNDIDPHEWLTKYEINYNSCEHIFYDDEDYYYYDDDCQNITNLPSERREYLETEDRCSQCHRTLFPNESLEERFFPGVKQCCGLHGYIQEGKCKSEVSLLKSCVKKNLNLICF